MLFWTMNEYTCIYVYIFWGLFWAISCSAQESQQNRGSFSARVRTGVNHI